MDKQQRETYPKWNKETLLQQEKVYHLLFGTIPLLTFCIVMKLSE